METKGPARKFIRLLQELQHTDEARRQTAESAGVGSELLRLRQWQSQRLARTYADLLEDPQYTAACQFFLTDIYAAKDFHYRDADAERLHEILSRYLPESMLRLLADTIRLNRMSARLDQSLLETLMNRLGVSDAIQSEAFTEAYAEGYRLCDNRVERQAQIELLAEVLREAATGARRPIFSVSLRLARIPAQRLGWNELYDFLRRGYLACRPLRDVEHFVGTISRRETEILENIYTNKVNWLLTIA